MQIIVKLPESTEDTREWALIEMQGELESRIGAGQDLSGKFVGDLVNIFAHFSKTSKRGYLYIAARFSREWEQGVVSLDS